MVSLFSKLGISVYKQNTENCAWNSSLGIGKDEWESKYFFMMCLLKLLDLLRSNINNYNINANLI